MITEYSISTIMPIWNEIGCITTALDQVHDFLEEHFADFEIIIIESGSTDGSGPACDAFAEGKRRVSVVHEGARNGFGSALKLGFGRATKDLVWTVTADLPFSLDVILTAVPLFKKHDCVLSYRAGDNRNLFRRAQSVVYNNLSKWLLGLEVTHVNSTVKVFRRTLAQSLQLESKRWLVETEINFRLRQLEVDTAEIPVPLIARTTGTSSVNLFTPVQIFCDLIKFTVAQRKQIRRAPQARAEACPGAAPSGRENA